jgi:4-carboxymuconolactone decarboxylase
VGESDAAGSDAARKTSAPNVAASSMDIKSAKQTYIDMFGQMPPLPKAKFEFLEDIDTAFLGRVEELRAAAFLSPVFDQKTTQLMIFAVLLSDGAGPAEWHAIAARRAGATWEELAHVVELVAAVQALGPSNQGGAMLSKLRAAETTTD